MPLLLTQAEAADELGTDREHIRELVRSGELQIIAYRSRELISVEELVRWVRENKRQSTRWRSDADVAGTIPSIGTRDRASARRHRRAARE
ncbi:MAG: helix-turn-helix domain-containing protein [Geminicoccaceae bacterium]